MYLIVLINQNLILCDLENKKIYNKAVFLIKIIINCPFLNVFNKVCHFTINVHIYIKCSSFYASEFIPYTYLNYKHVFLIGIFFSLLIFPPPPKK